MHRRAKRPGYLPSEFHLETLEKWILFSADAAFNHTRCGRWHSSLQHYCRITELTHPGYVFLPQAHIFTVTTIANELTTALSPSPFWRLPDPIPILVNSDDDDEQMDAEGRPLASVSQSVAADYPANSDIKYG